MHSTISILLINKVWLIHIIMLMGLDFWDEYFSKIDSLSLWGSDKVCIYFTFPRPHLWDFTGYVVVYIAYSYFIYLIYLSGF